MNTQAIDGECYARMLCSAAATLSEHAQQLNDLNVFPVADGDTGTNMLRTVEGGLCRIEGMTDSGIGALSERFCDGVMLSARGNSGVILSQIFAGMNETLKHCDTAGARELAAAFENGVKRSYAAVQTPTEGTILTVLRESTEYACGNMQDDCSVEQFLTLLIDQAGRSLERTPQLLPALAEAGVVDSGAAGYLCIAQGMYRALEGDYIPYRITHAGDKASDIDIDSFTRDSILEHGYCTEVLIRLTTAKTDPDTLDIDQIRDLLGSLGGESIVAYKQDDIVKVHVHTYTPGEIIASLHRSGEFLSVKIETMSLSHSETLPVPHTPERGYSVIAVSSGEGISALFSQMGADIIIDGGQGNNPSVETFTEAFARCGSREIIVLPNNNNILLAARAAAQAYEGARVHVIETGSMTQGYSALSVITPAISDVDALAASAQRAADQTSDGEIPQAQRDASVNGIGIKKGEYIAISGSRVICCEKSAEDAVMRLLEHLQADMCEIITLFVSRETDDERRTALTERLRECYDECEITVYMGGQDVYDYLVSVE